MILLEVVKSHITYILEELFKIERGTHNEILTLLTSVTRTSIDFFLGRTSPFRFTFKQPERKEVKVSAFLQLLYRYSRIPVEIYRDRRSEQ